MVIHTSNQFRSFCLFPLLFNLVEHLIEEYTVCTSFLFPSFLVSLNCSQIHDLSILREKERESTGSTSLVLISMCSVLTT